MTTPVLVIVLDGLGLGRRDDGDAVHLARTPTLDRLDRDSLRTTLCAHGTHVGMPDDSDMGNSEVGHNALGAGRIYEQGATLVKRAIRSGTLFDRAESTSRTWFSLVDRVTERESTLHLIGLLSDGNVHSHIDHIIALAENAAREGVHRLRLHVLLDGRDVSGQSALVYIEAVETVFDRLNSAGADYRIASGGGRMLVTMDRYGAEWDMVERGWQAHVLGEGPLVESASEAVRVAREAQPDLNDQFLPPFVVADSAGPVGRVEDGDAVLLFNFRGDRAIELCEAFEHDDFERFDRVRRPDVLFAGMMQYDGDRGLPAQFLVSPPEIRGTLGELLANSGRKQLAVSETQKFGHVTYFWNGNRSDPFDAELERYIEIPSDRVLFEQRPWMKAAEITDATIEALTEDPDIAFVRINYPNGDMVGHTGSLEAAIIAVEATDLSLGRLLAFVERIGATAIITADHGNCDQMFQVDKHTGDYAVAADGRRVPHTAHTLNPVPLWVFAPNRSYSLVDLKLRRLSNVAATALLMMGIAPPESMDSSLIA